MREVFRGYFRPSLEEFDSLWAGGAVVLDTNTLLNLYRYSPATRDELLQLLAQLEERLWLPHQVGLEYLRRRLDVIESQSGAFANIQTQLAKGVSGVVGELNRYRRHPTLNHNELADALERGVQDFREQLELAQSAHSADLPLDPAADPIAVAITALYDGRVGPEFCDDELAQIYSEGAKRYESRIPPGFKDESKGEPDKYGDLVLWKQTLHWASKNSKDVIFVTDDSKEDWWAQRSGKTIGPRPELVREFHDVCGRTIYFYSPEQFMRLAHDRLSASVSDGSLEEVGAVSEGNSQRANREQLASTMSALLERHREMTKMLEEEQRHGLGSKRLDSLRSTKQHLENELGLIKVGLNELDNSESAQRNDWPIGFESRSERREELIGEFNLVKSRLLEVEREMHHSEMDERTLDERSGRFEAEWLTGQIRALEEEIRRFDDLMRQADRLNNSRL